jgi:hypothetical protein
MGMRRFTWLTNAFTKKIENHEYMIAIYFMHYNFCRIHRTLRGSPAMEAEISNHVWTLEEIVRLLNQAALLPISHCIPLESAQSCRM